MRSFIIFFTEKEGTTPLVHLLDGFSSVSVVHQEGGGWEPFDRHNCGPMRLSQLERCLRLLYGDHPIDIAAVNRIYLVTGTKPLAAVERGTAVGFKMRFRPANRNALHLPVVGRLARVERATNRATQAAFRRRMISVLRDLDVTVFVTVRQDILRWGLSKYHGDGTGRPGHIQFALAEGRIQRSDIGTMRVDPDRLATILAGCQQIHEAKQRLLDDLEAAGVHTSVLRYEDFVSDQPAYFSRLLETLEIEPRPGEIDGVLARGTAFEKVHSDDLAEFVENADEVLEMFGDAFVAW